MKFRYYFCQELRTPQYSEWGYIKIGMIIIKMIDKRLWKDIFNVLINIPLDGVISSSVALVIAS